MPKFLGVASKRGFLVVLEALEGAKGAGAGFLDDLVFGGYFTRMINPKAPKDNPKRLSPEKSGHGDESISKPNHNRKKEFGFKAGFGALVPIPSLPCTIR